MVYILPRKLIKSFLFLLVLLEGWISTSLFRELITSSQFQLVFIHSHFKAVSFLSTVPYRINCFTPKRLQSAVVAPSCFCSPKLNYQFILIFPHLSNESKSLSF